MLPALAIHESLWRYYSKLSDKKDEDRDICEMFLIAVAQVDPICARDTNRRLEEPDSRLCMETVLN